MRILALTNLFPNPFQPTRATFNRQQVRAVAQLAPIRVISPIAWTDELSARCHGAMRLPRDRRVYLDGITVDHPRYVHTPKIFRGSYGHFYAWSVGTLFERVLDEFQPDILLAPWAYPDGWAAVRLGRKFGLPTVIKVHGSDVRYRLDEHPRRRLRTIEALQGADGVMAVSKDLARHVADFGVPPNRIRVVYDGIDTELFSPGSQVEARQRLGLPAHGNIILAVGRLVEVKGYDVLIKACATLKHLGLDFTCHIVGDGPLKTELLTQIDQAGLTGIVKLHGARPHAELGDWFRAADMFVMSSHSEGVPCVLLEAMACKAPFVATRVGGIPEVAELGDGQLVPPNDPAALADAIMGQLLDDETGHSAPEPYRKTHLQAAQELTQFLRSVLGRKDNRRHALVAG